MAAIFVRGLLRENCIALPQDEIASRLRIVDGTIIKEPGKTGSQWRILYSLQLPTLVCDFFEMTPTEGRGTGESFRRLPVRPRELILAMPAIGRRRDRICPPA